VTWALLILTVAVYSLQLLSQAWLGNDYPALLGLKWGPAIVRPTSLRPVYKAWMKVGEAIGFVNSRIILFIFFYLILAPMGMIIRLFGYDPMRRKHDDSPSYRVESKVPTSAHSMERPY